MALGGAHRSSTLSIILAHKWGVRDNHRLLAFSRKKCSFSKDNFLERPLNLTN